MTQSPVRWGVLGTAAIARDRIIPAMLCSSYVDLVGVAGRDPAKTEAWRAKLGAFSVYPSYDSLLQDPGVEVVYVPLPNALHHQWVLRSLEAGKHVLCEKPLGCSTREVEQMQAMAYQKGLLLGEAFAYVQSPLVALLKAYLAEGRIGKLRHLESHFCYPVTDATNIRLQAELGGGALNDLGCYPLHLITSLVRREPESVFAVSRRGAGGVDRGVAGVLGFDQDLTASFSAGFDSIPRSDTTLWGELGRIHLQDTYLGMPGCQSIELVADDSKQSSFLEGSENYQSEIEQFSQAVRGNADFLISPHETLATARLLDRVRAVMG